MAEEAHGEFLVDEATLVERAKTDDEAFDILYQFYLPKIYGYILKRIGRPEAAEDIVSETFLSVFCHLKKYQSRNCSFSAWIYRIATNKLIDYYRRSDKHPEISLEEIQNKPDTTDSALVRVIKQEEGQKVRLIIEKLPVRYQKVLQLKFFAELSNEELAAALGVSVNNARVLLHRALRKFKKSYEII